MPRRRKVTPKMEVRFEKYRLEGLSYAAIGRIENVSADTVRNYLTFGGNTEYLNFRAREMGLRDWQAYKKLRLEERFEEEQEDI